MRGTFGIISTALLLGRPPGSILIPCAFLSSCVAFQQPMELVDNGISQATNPWPYQRPWTEAWKATRSYQRIRIWNRDDIERLYPLIAVYVQQPELAFTVNELAVDTSAWPAGDGCTFRDEVHSELNEPPLPVDESGRRAIKKYVRQLDLSGTTTDAMIQAFDWKGQHLLGEKPSAPEGFEKHNRKYAEAATVVLLSLARNITTLYYYGSSMDAMLNEYLLKSNYRLIAVPGLQKLRRVEILPDEYHTMDSRTYEQCEFLEFMRYFHRLPSIHTVAGQGLMEYQNWKELFPPKTGNIKSLDITHVDISNRMLATIIRIPRALEELKLSMGGMWQTDGGSPMVYPKTLGKCLLEHKDSLSVLDLDIAISLHPISPEDEEGIDEDVIADMEYEGGFDEWYKNELDEFHRMDEGDSEGPISVDQLPNTRPYGTTIGSMHDFTKLTMLSINIELLLGVACTTEQSSPCHDAPFRLVDALPRNLEFLCLYGYHRGKDARWDDHVDEMMRLKDEKLPTLREIHGVSELVEVVGSDSWRYEAEEGVWERPDVDLSWVEA